MEEIALESASDYEAITFAQRRDVVDHAAHGGLAILFNPSGRRLWETVFEPVRPPPARKSRMNFDQLKKM